MRLPQAFFSVLFVGLTHTLTAQTVMVTNLNATETGEATITSGNWIAGSFTTDNSAASFTLNSVVVKIDTVTTAMGDFSVGIYSNSGSLPGTQIGSLLSGATIPNAGNNVYTASNLTLASNTTYWLVAGLSSGSTGAYEWDLVSASTISTWTINNAEAKSANLGGTWVAINTTPPTTSAGAPFFSVTATAIPEPITAPLLLGLSAVGLAWCSRRRTRVSG